MDTHELSDAGLVVRESVPSSDTVRVRFGEIDGLRAIAIFTALVYEATRFASPGAHWRPVLARVFADCGQGLSLFFLLSGFVLAYPALATLRTDGCTYLDLGRYVVKRILRFYPAYIVVLGLTFVVPPLAVQYGLPALATGSSGLGNHAFVANLFFAGTGLDNDGFRILALEARWCLVFPLILLLWARLPRVFFALAIAVAAADVLYAPAHAWGLGSLFPFMLGIAAADVRAGHLRVERFAFIVAGVAALAAIALEPFVALLPGTAGAPGALRFDPLWSLALFGLLLGAGSSGAIERILSMHALRLLGAASFGISLVMVPVSNFVIRQVLAALGPGEAAANAIVFSVLAGFVIWQLADRWFAEGNLRRNIADVVGPWLDALLHVVRADRVMLGSLPVASPDPSLQGDVDPSFYAPPPRPASGDLAVVSMRSGSPEDLAAEIMEMKKRLSDRSSALFAEADASEPGSVPAAVNAEDLYVKPGFYRRPQGLANGAATPGAAKGRTAELPVVRKIATQDGVAQQPQAPPPPLQVSAPSNVTPLRPYIEPQPISLSFEAKPEAEAKPETEPSAATPAASPEYQHFSLESTAGVQQQQAPPAQPVAPTSRGPIKMRLGPIGNPSPSVNGNGKHPKVNSLDG
jgi:peptidoglycan/LPS O-acetylase OafA/YrhL